MPFIHNVVKVPSKANKELLSKMKKEEEMKAGNLSVQGFFNATLSPSLKQVCGELQQASIVLRSGGSPIEVDALTDPIVDYIVMELKQFIFVVDAGTPTAAPAMPMTAVLVRQHSITQGGGQSLVADRPTRTHAAGR